MLIKTEIIKWTFKYMIVLFLLLFLQISKNSLSQVNIKGMLKKEANTFITTNFDKLPSCFAYQ